MHIINVIPYIGSELSSTYIFWEKKDISVDNISSYRKA